MIDHVIVEQLDIAGLELHLEAQLFRQLRQKIEAKPDDPQIILTEPGIGYRVADGG